MTTDQQTIQQPVFQLLLLDESQNIHEVLRVDVAGLQLHFSLDGAIVGLQSLADQLPERFDEVGLVLAYAVPAFLSVGDFEILPIGRLLTGVLLNGGEDFVDQKGHLEEPGIVHIVCQNV